MARPYRKGGKNATPSGATRCVKHTTPCRFYQRGKCNDQSCPYLHVKAGVVPAGRDRAGPSPTAASSTSGVISTVLKLFFEKHLASVYNAESRMLDLSRLGTKAEMASIGASVNFNARAFCDALAHCIADNFKPPPAALSLDDNDIGSVYPLVHAMMEVGIHTSLQALSLAANRIETCDFAKELKNLSSLVELNMLGNPAAQREEYRPRLRKYLPSLVILDMAPFHTPPLALPWPTFYQTSDTATAACNSGAVPARVYDRTQTAILHFIQTAVLNPLEQEPGCVPAGTVTGVDAVSEAYALTAMLSVSLSCPEAAVTTPQSAATSASATAAGQAGARAPAGGLRNMVRDIVGLRLRQTESDHNLVHRRGAKAAQVAVGRTQVCAQLEHLLYPRTFAVGHYIHASPDVAVLDNNGFGPTAPVRYHEPVAAVTLHGVMVWRHRPDGPKGGAAASTAAADQGALRITRNFSRVLTVAMTDEGGKWQIVNDMVTLYPYPGRCGTGDRVEDAAEEDLVLASTLREPGGGRLPGTGPSLAGGLLDDLHPYDVVFHPATDPWRAARVARRFRVPPVVVAAVSRAVTSDAELFAVLADVEGMPMDAFERCAQLAQGDPLAGVLLCRLQNRYGVDPATTGLQLLAQHGLDWATIAQTLSS